MRIADLNFYRNILKKVLLFISFSIGHLSAQDFLSGASFLELPFNAYQQSVGSTASAEGLDAINYNPAATSQPERRSQIYWEVAGSYLQLSEDILFTNLGYIHRLPNGFGTTGVLVSFLNHSSIDSLDILGNVLDSITAYDLALGVNYSIEFISNFFLGANLKLINQKLDVFNGFAFAADVGIKGYFEIDGNDLWISIAANNFGSDIKFEEEGTPLPGKIHSSISFTLRNYIPTWLALDISPQFAYNILGFYDAGAGLDVIFTPLNSIELYLQSKYIYSPEAQIFSFGTGGKYKIGSYKIDLGFGINPIAIIGIEYMISGKISYSFGIGRLPKVKAVDFGTDLEDQTELDDRAITPQEIPSEIEEDIQLEEEEEQKTEE